MIDKEYFIGYIMICKGNIKELEEEMNRKKFKYEEHIEFENELELDGENLVLQMDRNLVKNFSRKRVEIVCKAEKEKWKNSMKNSSRLTSINTHEEKKKQTDIIFKIKKLVEIVKEFLNGCKRLFKS